MTVVYPPVSAAQGGAARGVRAGQQGHEDLLLHGGRRRIGPQGRYGPSVDGHQRARRGADR
eukprot:18876-Eustigmatos_ZCMA.PRE.1